MWVTLCASQGTTAEIAGWNTKITQILTDTTRFGGCMIYLERGAFLEGLNCPQVPSALSVDCLGLTTSKTAAASVFQNAQLALVTQATVYVVATDDAPKLNGFCRATRLDVQRVVE
jgi:hypothetical protein